MPRSVVLRVEGLGVQLGGTMVLNHIDVEVNEGEFLTVVGPNGAGKSTLLRALVGLVAPGRGSVRLNGQPLSAYSRRLLAQSVSYVPQGDPGGVGFTVREFVEMGRYAHLGPFSPLTKKDRAAIEGAMAITEVGHLSQRRIGALSGGERQRTMIAAALAQGGRLLLLDEPTSFLDYRHQVQVLELLDHLHKDKGYAVVAVTHDLNLMVPLSDTVLALKDGEVEFSGPPARLLDTALLESIFSNPFRLIAVEGNGSSLVIPDRRSVRENRS